MKWWSCLLATVLASVSSAAAFAQTSPPGGSRVPDAGEYHSCALLEDGSLNCWGDNTAGQVLAPQGKFIAVTAGFDHSCALLGNGQPICWGNPDAVSSAPPVGPYVSLSAGRIDNCGLRSDGQLRCWGGAMSAAAPTSGTYTQVSIADGRGCAIRTDGTLACWQAAGVSSLGAVPAGEYLALSLGSSHACALRSDGKAQCWGSNAQGQSAAPTSPDFIAIASGHQHSCGIRDDGALLCWGSNASGQLNAPAGRFDAVTAGRLHTCARNEEGSVQCWGGNGSRNELATPAYNYQTLAVGPDLACGLVYLGNYGCAGTASALAPPVRRYNGLSFGELTGCGLGVDGRAHCWGASLGTPPGDILTTISIGDTHVCGLRPDGGAVCWGDNSFGQATPPPQSEYEAFTVLASGDRFTCGLSGYAGLVCWGQGAAVTDAPEGLFASLSVHAGNACVTDFSGYAHCWGSDAALLQPPSNETFASIAVGARHVCAIGTTSDPFSSGPMQCWGDNSQGQLQAPAGLGYFRIAAFGDTTCVADINQLRCWGAQTLTKPSPTLLMAADSVAAGAAHSCTVRSNRGVGCWGDAAAGQRNVPPHRTRGASANADHSCSLRSDGQPTCWGDNTHGGATPPTGTVRALDAGQFNACAVAATGSAGCWGWNVNGQGTPPAGSFRSVATGLNHSCGVRAAGTLACWGYNADGQANAPAGLFREVDVGERHSCAIDGDGGLQCWGLGSEGQTTLPDLPGASYRALAVGTFHNCAILSLGNVVCWGRNDQGQATPPEEGAFVSIAAGAAHTCAVRDDGIRLCWGANDQGQAPQLSIGPATLPRALVDADYRVDLTVGGGGGYLAPAPRFQFVEGELPWGLTITEYGQLIGRPTTEGTYSMTLRAVDENGMQAERTIVMTVEPAVPQIEAVVVGVERNGSGWYSSDVHVSWIITPLGNGLTTSGCDPVTVDDDTTGVEFHCIATSNSGTTERTVSLRRDATPPQTVLLQVPPTQNNYGVEEQQFTFESVGPDLSGHAGFECNPTQYESEYSFFDCASPYVIGAQTFPGNPGTYTMRVRAKDAAGNVDPTPATFTWTILQDTSIPVIVPTFVGTAGDNGWYLSDVSLTWSVTDPQTPLRDVVGCEPFTLNVEGSNGQYCEAKSWAGRAQAVVVLRRDTVAPAVSATLTTAANAAGWYRNDVTVAFACSDAMSGLAAACPASQVLSQEGAAVSSTAQTVRDVAGNVTTSNVLTIKLDKTPPVTTNTPTTQPNAAGWYRNDVVVNFTCSDALSGLVAPCTPQMIVTTEGSNNPGELIYDVAGNLAFTGGTGILIDKTAPTISATFTGGAANANGWYRTDAWVIYNCSDSLSGIPAGGCPQQQLYNQEGIFTAPALTVSDTAGNVSAPSNSLTVQIDKTAPVLNVVMPSAQLLLNATHSFNLDATDALSGIASQNCGAINTATLGTRTVTCTATDRAGNTTSRSATYRVVYDVAPLSAPMSNPGQLYLVEAPRSVPFEWRVRDANGVAITNATLTQTSVTQVTCPNSGVPLPTPPAGETDTFENFGDGRYRRNWWVNYTGNIVCLRLDVVLNDGVARSATIRVVPKIRRTGGPGQPQVATPAARSAPSSRPVATPRSTSTPARQPVKTRRDVQRSVKSRTR